MENEKIAVIKEGDLVGHAMSLLKKEPFSKMATEAPLVALLIPAICIEIEKLVFNKGE